MTSRLLSVSVLPMLLAAVLWQCDSSSNDRLNSMQNQASSRAETGMWGGQRIRLQVSESSTGIDYDCAHGSIEGPFRIDSSGRFDLTGTHISERPGPQREGQTNARPARYTGSINGATMTFIVTLTDTGESVGTFTLTHGRGTRIVKCL